MKIKNNHENSLLSQACFPISKLIMFIYLNTFLTFFLFPAQVFADYGPAALNINGTVFSGVGTPATGFVQFRLRLMDKDETCVLYEEFHLGVNLTSTSGNFSLNLGSGSSRQNFVQSSTNLTSYLFRNDVNLTGGFTGCAGGLTLAAGDHRKIQVEFDHGSGYTAMTPALQILNEPYSSVAETLQGRTPANFQWS